jgi:hypothetical protein
MGATLSRPAREPSSLVTGEGEEARPLESKPAHPIRSVPRRPNATLRGKGRAMNVRAGGALLAAVLVLGVSTSLAGAASERIPARWKNCTVVN